MRLCAVGTLLGLLVLVQGSPWENPVTDYDYKCANDGWRLKNGTCSCPPNYYSNDCTSRKCLNFGRNAISGDLSSRCSCPIGFLGGHCEPAKCVGGAPSLGTFSNDANRQSLSVLALWNDDLQQKLIKSEDNFEQAVCDLFNNTEHRFLLISAAAVTTTEISEREKCYQQIMQTRAFCAYNNENECNTRNLTAAIIHDTLDRSLPNSHVLIFTNMGLQDENITSIIQKATARGNTISVFVTAPLGSNLNKEYRAPPFQRLETITKSTLGIFVTPYDGMSNVLLGTDNFSDVLTKFMPTFIRSKTVDIVQGSAITIQPTVHVVFRDDQHVNANVTSSSPLNMVVNTGFLQVLKVDQYSLLMDSNASHIFYIIGDPGFDDGLTITTSAEIDAARPYIARSSTSNILVSAASTQISLLSEGTSLGAVSTKITRSADCQFPIILGNVTDCKEGEVSLFKLSQGTVPPNSVVIPLFCASTEAVFEEFAEIHPEENHEHFLEPSSVNCTQPDVTSPLIRTDGRRTIALMVNNVLSITESLFRGDSNVMEKLFDRENVGLYISQLFPNPFQTAEDNFGNFMDNVMNDISETSESVPIAVTDITVLLNSIEEATFFDLFIIVDQKLLLTPGQEQNDLDRLDSAIYSKRARVHFLAIRSPAGYNDPYSDEFQRIANVAAGNGGLAVLFDSIDDVIGFIDHFDFVIDREVVATFDGSPEYSAFSKLTFTASENETVYAVVMSSTPANILFTSGSGTAENGTLFFNASYMAVYAYTPSSSGEFVLSTTQQVFLQRFTLRLYSSIQSLDSIAFANDVDGTNYLSAPKYGIPVPQYVLFHFQESGNYSVTISKNVDGIVNPMIQDKASIPRYDCGENAFDELLYYNWICPINHGLFYIQVTSNKEHSKSTRTFPFRCNGDNVNHCLHGGSAVPQEGSAAVCACTPGWEGDVCELPICLNGGNVTVSNQCSCPQGFAGFFCEGVSTVTAPSDLFPNYRSVVGSLIFVIEKSETVANALNNFIDLGFTSYSPQLIVVQYDSSTVTSTLASFDYYLLADALQFITPTSTASPAPNTASTNALKAIKSALKLQMSKRSVVFWLAEDVTELASIDDELKRLIGETTAEIRPYLIGDSANANLTKLALFGNGVPLTKTTDFSTVASTYIKSFLPNGTKAYEAKLNVIEYGNCANTGYTTTVHITKETTTLFVTVYGKDHRVSALQGTVAAIGGVDGLYSISQLTEVNTVTLTVSASDHCIFSVESVSGMQVAYGYSAELNDQNVLTRTPGDSNWLNVLWTGSINVPTPDPQDANLVNSYVNVLSWNIPSLEEANFSTIGTYEMASIRNSSFDPKFPYAPKLPTCNANNTDGLLLKLQGKDVNGNMIQKVIVAPCIAQDDFNITCNHGLRTESGLCECYPGYTKPFCSKALDCHNGGSNDNGKCSCAPGFTGTLCETPIYCTQKLTASIIFMVDLSKVPAHDDNVIKMKQILQHFALAFNLNNETLTCDTVGIVNPNMSVLALYGYYDQGSVGSLTFCLPGDYSNGVAKVTGDYKSGPVPVMDAPLARLQAMVAPTKQYCGKCSRPEQSDIQHLVVWMPATWEYTTVTNGGIEMNLNDPSLNGWTHYLIPFAEGTPKPNTLWTDPKLTTIGVNGTNSFSEITEALWTNICRAGHTTGPIMPIDSERIFPEIIEE